MATEVIQGNNLKVFYRLKKWAKERPAELVPYQTSAKLTFKRDSDSTKTKDGNVATSASLEPELEVEFINNSSVAADEFYQSVLNNEEGEAWLVDIDRLNKDGKNYAWYMQVTVSEDETEAKTGDASERSITFAVNGQPKRGWLALTQDQHDQVDYIFRGTDKVVTAEDGTETNGGTAWKDEDEGTYVPKDDDLTKEPETPPSTESGQ